MKPVRDDVQDEAIAFERAFRTRHPAVWIATLIGPFVVAAALLGLVAVVRGDAHARRLVVAAAAGFAFLGRFLILAGRDPALAEAQGAFSAEELFGLVLFMDLATAVVVTFHMGALFRLPWLGRRLGTLVADGRAVLAERPWLRHLTFGVTVLFVTFPLAATGSVGGSVLGRLLGLQRWATLAAIACGSLLGCALMYFGAAVVERYVDRDDPAVKIGGAALVVAAIVLLNVRYRRAVRRSVTDRS